MEVQRPKKLSWLVYEPANCFLRYTAGSQRLLHCDFSIPHSGDLYPENEKDKDAEEPEWVKSEREHFTEFRDKNKDGKMDRVCHDV